MVTLCPSKSYEYRSKGGYCMSISDGQNERMQMQRDTTYRERRAVTGMKSKSTAALTDQPGNEFQERQGLKGVDKKHT